jgi:hypothetical protein
VVCYLIRRAGRLDQCVALTMRQGAALGIEQVASRRIDTNVDMVTDARRVAAFGLGDDEGLPGQAQVEKSVATEALRHDDIAGELARFRRPQVFGPYAQCDLTVTPSDPAATTSVSKKFIFGEPMNPATNRLTGWW